MRRISNDASWFPPFLLSWSFVYIRAYLGPTPERSPPQSPRRLAHPADRASEDDQGENEEEQAYRARNEDGQISAREQQRAAEVLFEERSEDEAEKKRCWREVEPRHHEADDTEGQCHQYIEARVVDAVDADADEEEHRWVEQVVGDRQQPDP